MSRQSSKVLEEEDVEQMVITVHDKERPSNSFYNPKNGIKITPNIRC